MAGANETPMPTPVITQIHICSEVAGPCLQFLLFTVHHRHSVISFPTLRLRQEVKAVVHHRHRLGQQEFTHRLTHLSTYLIFLHAHLISMNWASLCGQVR